MGLINLFKMATDYVKAKKLLKEKNIKLEKIKELIEKIRTYIDKLKEVLNALKKYSGTVIFVSHERDFVNSLATKVYSIEELLIS